MIPDGREPEPRVAKSGPKRKAWKIALCLVLVFHALILSRDLNRPWRQDPTDFNGAFWSQAAHNFLRAGVIKTMGVPAGFYFGPLPIPVEGFYVHHPTLLPLMVTGVFAILGEDEWAARLIAVVCSLVSAILIWFLVRSCAGPRAAAFAAAVFAALPMEILYGNMINFEPSCLMWMLGGLLALRRWDVSGSNRARNLALVFLTCAMWIAWPGYFLSMIAAAHFFAFGPRRKRMFARLLVVMAAGSFSLYLFQIQAVQPGSWHDAWGAALTRASSSSRGHPFTSAEWALHVGRRLLSHLPWSAWIGAALGAIVCFRRGASADLRWLGQVAFWIFGMTAFYMVVFRNASFIHDFAAFYFVFPVAACGGVGLDWFLKVFEQRLGGRRGIATCAVCLVLAGWAALNIQQADRLRSQVRLLAFDHTDPPLLIPALGHAISAHFPEQAAVRCNFTPHYGPFLEYYAQRAILRNRTREDWEKAIAEGAHFGVVWLGAPDAEEIVARWPPDSVRRLEVEGEPFAFWQGK